MASFIVSEHFSAPALQPFIIPMEYWCFKGPGSGKFGILVKFAISRIFCKKVLKWCRKREFMISMVSTLLLILTSRRHQKPKENKGFPHRAVP